MTEAEVRERAFAMPLTSPAYPPGPYRFIDREYLIISYRTDPAKLRALVPEPLEIDEHEPLVKYEFIRMPDSTGFGDYTETGQVIPVSFRGRKGGYTHAVLPPFEPAADTCARAVVESSICTRWAVELVAASASNMASNTPDRLSRQKRFQTAFQSPNSAGRARQVML